MPRGAARPKKSPENARAAKDRAKAEKQRQLAASARASLPESPEKRKEIFAELEGFEAKVKDAQANLSHHKKRMKDVFGMHPKAVQIRRLMLGIKDSHEYNLVHAEVLTFLADEGRPLQTEMDLTKNPDTDKDGPLFDKTKAGKAIGQARPVERAPEAPAPQAATPGIPLEEAQAAFEANSAGKFPTEEEIAEKNRRIAEQKAADDAAFKAEGKPSNVVQMPAPKPKGKPGRPALSPEEREARAKERDAARKAARHAEKAAAQGQVDKPSKSVKDAADRAEKASKSPKPTMPVEREPIVEDDDIPPMIGAPGSGAEITEPSGGYRAY